MLEDAIQMHLDFRVCGCLLGDGHRGKRRDERSREVLGGHRVVGDLARPCQLAGRRQGPVALERVGDRAMDRDPLGRKELVVGGLTNERVPERVSGRGIDDMHEHALLDRVSERRDERPATASRRPARAARG